MLICLFHVCFICLTKSAINGFIAAIHNIFHTNRHQYKNINISIEWLFLDGIPYLGIPEFRVRYPYLKTKFLTVAPPYFSYGKRRTNILHTRLRQNCVLFNVELHRCKALSIGLERLKTHISLVLSILL